LSNGRRGALVIAVVVVIGVGLRSFLAVAFLGNFDESSFEIVAEIERRGGNVFLETSRYNYTPVWALLLHGFDLVAIRFDMPLHAVVRLALTAVDVGNAALIGLIALRATGRDPGRAFASYLLNPVAILVVGYHGQFETLAALPLLAAIALDARGASRWLLGTVSLVVKHIFAFQVWLLYVYGYRPIRATLLFALTGVTFIATFIPYLPEGGPGIVRNVFGYSGLHGFYGLSSLLSSDLAAAVCIATLAALPLAGRRLGLDLARCMRLSSVAMLAVIFGIGEQYFLIPILFATPFGGRWYWIYSLVATVFLLASPNNVHLIDLPPPWNAVWVVALAWTASLAIDAARGRGRVMMGVDSTSVPPSALPNAR
jgi:hypothetical protein